MKSSFKNLKILITRLLPILFNVNIHLQKLSIGLFNDLKNLIGERMFCNILLGYESESTQNRIITIADLMASCTPVAGSVNNLLDLNRESFNVDNNSIQDKPGTLLGHLFVYIFETLDSFKKTYECKTKIYGGLWSHHQLCQLSSLIL